MILYWWDVLDPYRRMFASKQGEIREVLPRLFWGQSVVVLMVAQSAEPRRTRLDHTVSVRPSVRLCVRSLTFSPALPWSSEGVCPDSRPEPGP